MANTKTGDPAVDTFLKGYPPPVREIAVKAREAILSVMADATETVYPGWHAIQYGGGADMKCVFGVGAPQGERVNHGLANGVGLPDPDGLLEGEGKAIRHVKLTSPEAASAPAIRELVRGALQATRNGA